MMVRWEEYGAELQGEMEVTEDTSEGRIPFEGTRSGKTVVLNFPTGCEFSVFPDSPPCGTWVGKLVNVPEGVNAPPGPALNLQDPDGNRILLSTGTEQDNADAVARLAMSATEATVL